MAIVEIYIVSKKKEKCIHRIMNEKDIYKKETNNVWLQIITNPFIDMRKTGIRTIIELDERLIHHNSKIINEYFDSWVTQLKDKEYIFEWSPYTDLQLLTERVINAYGSNNY